MGYGTIQIGRLPLREALVPVQERTDDDGDTTLQISGQEASPPLTIGEIATMQDDIRGCNGLMVPVTFVDKSDRDGYYRVAQPQATLVSWGGEVVTCDWQMSLTRVGSPSEVDIESRLSGPLTRANNYSVTGERWHCPPGGHTAYWSGSTQPSSMTRAGEDGDLTVYRGVPLSTAPRYACELVDYPRGRVRFRTPVPETGIMRERTGTNIRLDAQQVADQWELHNSLVRVRWDSAGLRVGCYTGGAWHQRIFTVSVAGAQLGTPAQTSLLRNDYECATVRLLWERSPAGRTTVDVTLRRGARLAEFWAQTLPATTIAVALAAPDVTNASTGYIVGATDDGYGNRYLLGSAAQFAANTVTSTISATSAATFDWCAGYVIGGGSAAVGDGAATIYAQYLGSATEQVRAIRR